MTTVPTDNQPQQDSPKPWFVMIHHKPQWIYTMLDRESRGELVSRDERKRADYCAPEPFDFYVPYLNMRPDASNDLRSIFHSFVFIQASEDRIAGVLASDWNRLTRLRLYHYRDNAHHPIVISDAEMQRLKDIFLEQQLNVYIGQPVDDLSMMHTGNRVRLSIEGWEGQEGVIVRVKKGENGVTMDVALDILKHTKSIHFTNLHEGDVVFADTATKALLTGNIIGNIGERLAVMLGHRFIRKRGQDDAERQRAESNRQRTDTPRLLQILSLAGTEMHDNDEQRRLDALMLMAAVLLGQQPTVDRYRTMIADWTAGREEPRDATDCYLMLALFVAGRQARLRDAVKRYYKTHSDCPAIIGRFINKLRDMKAKKS